MSGRTYLGRRKVASPAAFDRHVRRVIADWQEQRIRTALGAEFRLQSRVLVVRPWWMPERLYRWLLRSIVVESRDTSR